MSDSEITLSLKEIKKLVEWLITNNAKVVTLNQVYTGIGLATEAKIKLSEDESLCKNITDYESW